MNEAALNYLKVVHQCPDCGADLVDRPIVFEEKSPGNFLVRIDGEEPDKHLRCEVCKKNWKLEDVWPSPGWYVERTEKS